MQVFTLKKLYTASSRIPKLKREVTTIKRLKIYMLSVVLIGLCCSSLVFAQDPVFEPYLYQEFTLDVPKDARVEVEENGSLSINQYRDDQLVYWIKLGLSSPQDLSPRDLVEEFLQQLQQKKVIEKHSTADEQGHFVLAESDEYPGFRFAVQAGLTAQPDVMFFASLAAPHISLSNQSPGSRIRLMNILTTVAGSIRPSSEEEPVPEEHPLVGSWNVVEGYAMGEPGPNILDDGTIEIPVPQGTFFLGTNSLQIHFRPDGTCVWEYRYRRVFGVLEGRREVKEYCAYQISDNTITLKSTQYAGFEFAASSTHNREIKPILNAQGIPRTYTFEITGDGNRLVLIGLCAVYGLEAKCRDEAGQSQEVSLVLVRAPAPDGTPPAIGNVPGPVPDAATLQGRHVLSAMVKGQLDAASLPVRYLQTANVPPYDKWVIEFERDGRFNFTYTRSLPFSTPIRPCVSHRKYEIEGEGEYRLLEGGTLELRGVQYRGALYRDLCRSDVPEPIAGTIESHAFEADLFLDREDHLFLKGDCLPFHREFGGGGCSFADSPLGLTYVFDAES